MHYDPISAMAPLI